MPDTRAASPVRWSGLLAAALSMIALLATSDARAQLWVESGDAGDLVSTAQSTVGAGSLIQIQGALAAPTDVDMYCVRIHATPPASTALIGLNCVAQEGPNVWFFDAAGNGIASNLPCSGGTKMIVSLPASLPPGLYYVAVSFSGHDPQSAGGAMWLPGPPAFRAPDGPGAGGTIIGWGGAPVVQPLNPYQVFFNPDFFSFCDAATPAAAHTWGELKIRYGR